jgi:IclR family mhp operon transcriptional activator
VTHNDDARGVTRTLAVLRALNTHNGATVTQLSRVTRISRPALYRILDALVHNGYVAADPDRKTYCLTYLVRSLSDGFRDEHWISEIAGPVMNDLQRSVLWPTDLATFANYEMRLRDTTRRQSPLVIDRSAVGAQLSFLRSALGLAYLAHCPASERGAILEMLQRPGHPDHGLASDTVRVLRLLREVRRRGYGLAFRTRQKTMRARRPRPSRCRYIAKLAWWRRSASPSSPQCSASRRRRGVTSAICAPQHAPSS